MPNDVIPDTLSFAVSSEINRKKLQNIKYLVQKLTSLDSTHDEAHTDYIASLCENTKPDDRYISEILLASGLLLRVLGSSLTTFQFHSSGHPINSELFLVLEQTKFSNFPKQEPSNKRLLNKENFHKKLIFDTVNEVLAKKLALVVPSLETFSSKYLKLANKTLYRQKLLRDLCMEIEELLQVKKKKEDDLVNEVVLGEASHVQMLMILNDSVDDVVTSVVMDFVNFLTRVLKLLELTGSTRRNCKLKDKGQEESNLVQEDVEPTLLMGVQEKRDKGKHSRASFPNQTNTKSSEPLNLVYGDLCGPISPKTESRKNYMFLLVDDCTRYMWVYFLKSKDEAFETFKEFKLKVENEVKKKLKSFRTDRGGEFTSREFTRYCKENGILRQLTAPYSPQHNEFLDAKVTKPHLKKLDDRSKELVYLGTEPGSKAYRLFDPVTKDMILSRDVKFKEDEGWDWKGYLDNINLSEPEWRDFIITENQTSSSRIIDEIEQPVDNPSTPPPYTYEPKSEDSTGHTSSIASSSRPLDHMPVRGYRNQSEIYNRAPKIEINSVNKNKTWKLATLPDKPKAIGLKWVFKTKQDGNGKIIKHKARLVAKGYVQEHGIDYDEVFYPAARMETVRLILALSAYHGWEVHHLDVKSAFLHGELKEEVYVTQPEGFKKLGNENKLYRLVKALYGLKQAPRAWNMNKEDLQKFKSQMEERFEMSDLGLLAYYLGIEVTQTEDGILIKQTGYASKILKEARMVDCNETKIPMDPRTKLIKTEGGELVDTTEYKSLVGGSESADAEDLSPEDHDTNTRRRGYVKGRGVYLVWVPNNRSRDGRRQLIFGYSGEPNYMSHTKSSRAKFGSLNAPGEQRRSKYSNVQQNDDQHREVVEIGASMRTVPFTAAKSDSSRSCLSGYSDHPNYMTHTQSSRANVRSLSAPADEEYQNTQTFIKMMINTARLLVTEEG
nr:ribonuclease H-like domain, reverse transcriptase, RNA-dependent DNA polymerase [Tanacetum cinerariifolium]